MRSSWMWHRKIVACIHILILSLCITLTIVPALALDVTDGLYKIAPDLQNQLYIAKNESQNEKVSAIVIMEHQPPHLGLNCKDANGLQRRQIIHSMRSLAENSQKDTLALLEKQKSLGNIEDVRAFWIVNAIAVKATPEVLEQLAQRPEVKLIEPDYKVKALEDTLPWGVDRIDAELVWNGTDGGTDVVAGRNAGDGINVAILDTGIDYTHEDLNDSYRGGIDYVNNDDDPMDDHGHGTHCAGIVAAVDNEIGVIGAAPEVNLYGVNVLNSSGIGYESDVVAGVQWAVDNGMKIISMSIGSDSDLASLHTALDSAYNAGLLLVAAAGNKYGPPVLYPAAYDSVIAVAATNNSDKRASFSSTGPAIELAAPGVSIYSTWWNDTYAISSGTSMACPHVAGTAALLWKAYPEYNNTQVRERLRSTAEDLGASGRDDEFGYGLVDAENATPPASITNLANTTGNFWINWTWTNPPDADFNHTMVYINGTLEENVSTPQNYYNNRLAAK
jgi:subtilisin